MKRGFPSGSTVCAGTGRVLLMVAVVAVLCVLQGCGGGKPSFSSEYQAVFLDNGQVFFGKVENAGSPYVRIVDAFYVQRQQSPDGKEVRNVLIKRGSEWHGPDMMYINNQHIVAIEPVNPNSRVAQLMKEAKTQAPAK